MELRDLRMRMLVRTLQDESILKRLKIIESLQSCEPNNPNKNLSRENVPLIAPPLHAGVPLELVPVHGHHVTEAVDNLPTIIHQAA